jgi:hypothetical protein
MGEMWCHGDGRVVVTSVMAHPRVRCAPLSIRICPWHACAYGEVLRSVDICGLPRIEKQYFSGARGSEIRTDIHLSDEYCK